MAGLVPPWVYDWAKQLGFGPNDDPDDDAVASTGETEPKEPEETDNDEPPHEHRSVP